MRILVVYCHPDPASFNAAVRDAALTSLRGAAHEVRLLDLYAAGFDPIMSRAERLGYYERGANEVAVRPHLDLVLWAQALIFVYPTWWYGHPAMLKGWLDRVFVPHATFEMPTSGRMVRPALTHIRIVAAITTLGSPRWWWWLVGQPGRKILLGGVAELAGRRCRKIWIALHDMDRNGAGERARFLDRVARRLAALPT